MAVGNKYHNKTQKIGDHTAICDRSGFREHASKMVTTWDGFLTLEKWSEERTGQDFVKGIRDQKPLNPQYVRNDVEDRIFTNKTNDEAALIADLLL